MSESLRSMILGPSALYAVAVVALALTVLRRVDKPEVQALDGVIDLYLIGVACQCLHFTEEFVTGFHLRLPPFLGLVPWSSEFFVTFNLIWMALWVSSAVGIRRNLRIAFFPLWFFTFGMIGNAVWHPLLALATGGYFPGLYTSPLGGGIGVALVSRLWKVTRPVHAGAT